jgi:hypothetical protein
MLGNAVRSLCYWVHNSADKKDPFFKPNKPQITNQFTDLPKMSPKNAPKLQKMTECHSTLIFMKRIANEAETMPK